jgi:hypothetical protein
LEPKLALEDPVQSLVVLARVRGVYYNVERIPVLTNELLEW